jgi:hypothetical protein
MANVQAVCNSFKSELLTGIHALGTTVVRATNAVDSLKAALYYTTASIDSSATVYTTTGEVVGANYTAGGAIVSNSNPPINSGSTAYWTPSGAFSWSTVTISTAFDCVLIYNTTQGNRAIATYTFTPVTVSVGNFSINMPTNNASTGLLRLS